MANRDAAIIAAAVKGETYAAIARRFGLSLTRVRQIALPYVGRRQEPTEDRNRQIIARAVAGEAYASIAAEFNLTKWRVRQIACKHVGPRCARRDVDLSQLRKLWAAGHADAEIGRQMGTPVHSVRYYRRQLGLPTNSPYDVFGPRARSKAVKLVINDGLSFGEAAMRTGLTRSAVAGAVHRANGYVRRAA